MTPFTLRPVPRAVLDWLAIVAMAAGTIGFLVLLTPDVTPVRCVLFVVCFLAVGVGSLWLTDWKHRASARREGERRSLNR